EWRSDIRTSSSVIADATHVTSRWLASPMRAVTSPPVPRRTSSPGPNVTGPRLETRMRGLSEDDTRLTVAGPGSLAPGCRVQLESEPHETLTGTPPASVW